VTVRFALTFDYLCPFARNANEAVAEAIEDGTEWDVEFRPFSLSQVHVDPGQPDVWDREPGSAGTGGVLALQWGVAVRDGRPDRFLAFHKALFDARHGRGRSIEDESELRAVAGTAGVDPDAVAADVAGGGPMATLAAEHDEAVARWGVFGVPTFIAGEEAVFVRLMERHNRADVSRVIDMVRWVDLNEFKRTRIPR
jgi:protein-disulfide isomerase